VLFTLGTPLLLLCTSYASTYLYLSRLLGYARSRRRRPDDYARDARYSSRGGVLYRVLRLAGTVVAGSPAGAVG
jgi:hypothetical protein